MTKAEILEEITLLTLTIKEQYPEVYPFLGENPATFGQLSEDKEEESFVNYKRTLEKLIQDQKEKNLTSET